MLVRELITDYQLEEAFNIRKKVFVEEQNVPLELEIDEFDNLSSTIHIGAFDETKVIATLRVLDINDPIVHIGRVAVDKQYRGRNIGYVLMESSENIIKKYKNGASFTIELSAQLYAEDFYSKLGYKRKNDNIYLDANIEHIDMYKNIN